MTKRTHVVIAMAVFVWVNSVTCIFFAENATAARSKKRATKKVTKIQREKSINPEIEKAYIDGVNEYVNDQFARAIPFFEKVVTADPGNSDAAYRLGICYARNREISKAIGVFKKLEETQLQKYPNVSFEIAKLYYELQNHAEARKYFVKAEKQGYKKGASQYFQAYLSYLDKDYAAARSTFLRMESDEKEDMDLRQSSSVYLGSIMMEEERADFPKNQFRESKIQFQKAIDMNSKSVQADIGRGQLREIERLLGHKPPQSKFSGSVIQSFEYDNNVLNETGNQTSDTGAAGLKWNTILDGKYRIIQNDDFYVHPELNFNFGYYFAIPDVQGNRDLLKSLHSIVGTTTVNMGRNTLWGRTPVELSAPLKCALTLNQVEDPGNYKYNTLAVGIAPSARWQKWEPYYTTVGGDLTYTFNANDSLSNMAIKGTATQSYQLMKELGVTFNSALTYTFLNNDRFAFLGSASFDYPWEYGMSWQFGVSYTGTKYLDDTSRNVDHLFNFNLAANRVMFDLIAVKLAYNFDFSDSKSQSNRYDKHRVSIQGTIAY